MHLTSTPFVRAARGAAFGAFFVGCASSSSTVFVDGGSPDGSSNSSTADGGTESGAVVTGQDARALCKRYVACTAKAAPATLAAVLDAYGDSGKCWTQKDETFCANAARRNR